jgi:serine phosphatase RsbU (regulator of sigma subunit)
MADNLDNYGAPDPLDIKYTEEKRIAEEAKLEKQRLNAELSVLVQAFENALSEAEAFADKHKLSFSIYPAYGMGGQYYGCTNNEDGWMPSSQGC